MNVLSLFSGIGGIDLGLERAGMTIAGQVEIDEWCRTILAKHWPEVPRHDDVRTAAGWWGRRPVDLVAGGFPCQPVSQAGKGLAQADSRWLWPAFANVIRHLGPAWVLVENVPGLLDPVRVKDGEGRFLGYAAAPVEEVLGDLAGLGYDAEWDCVPAAYVGAPHIRNRVWIVAYPASARRPARTPGASGEVWRPGQATWRPGPDGLGREVADAARIRSGQPRQRALDGSAGSRRAERLGAVGTQAVADADGRRFTQLPERDREPQPRIFTSFGHDARRCGLSDVNGESEGRPAEPRRERGQWVAEPDVGRVAHGIPRRVDRLRGLGNAVVPQVVEHIGRLILAADGECAA